MGDTSTLSTGVINYATFPAELKVPMSVPDTTSTSTPSLASKHHIALSGTSFLVNKKLLLSE